MTFIDVGKVTKEDNGDIIMEIEGERFFTAGVGVIQALQDSPYVVIMNCGVSAGYIAKTKSGKGLMIKTDKGYFFVSLLRFHEMYEGKISSAPISKIE